MDSEERDHELVVTTMDSEERDQELVVTTMDSEERDQELVEQAYAYLTTSTYPSGCTENRKRVVRKKAKKFELKDGELYYKQKQKGKVWTAHACRVSM